ncbi:MAG: hypothetical protein E7359_04225 [Clostridiales bacterium]|nr:hypothetical protein [Clostridiales bacterium]
MIKLLDNILLSENVCEKFNNEYDKNLEFRNWVLSLLPELEDCKKLNQDNPWHIYSVLNHILHAIEEMNKQTKNLDYNTRRMLAYTMFFHDIGKPECRIRRYSKLYKKEIDSFFNHNLASKKIAHRVLLDLDFCKKETEIIEKLIEDHDIFMFITLKEDGNKFHNVLTKDYLKSIIKDLNKIDNGEKLMKYLIMVGRADNKSQNPKMTKDALKLLDVMDEMLNNLNNVKELEY